MHKSREDNQEKWKDCLRKLEYKGAHRLSRPVTCKPNFNNQQR